MSKKRITITVSNEQHAKLQLVAERSGRSVQQVVRVGVESIAAIADRLPPKSGAPTIAPVKPPPPELRNTHNCEYCSRGAGAGHHPDCPNHEGRIVRLAL